MVPIPFAPVDSAHSARPRGGAIGRLRALTLLLCGCLVGVSSPAAEGDASLTVEDAQVEANEPGTFPLPFAITRTGDTADGVRILVETAVGGSNPGTPGEDYTALPPGTEVFIAPDATTGTATVDVIGDPIAGPDEMLLLQLTGARAFAPEPRLAPNAMHYRVCCLTRDLVTADLNGDGHPDVVVGNDLSFDFQVLLADGDGGFADAVTYPLAGNVALGRTVVAAGEVTGDGHVDLVVTGFNADDIELYAGDGAGGLEPAELIPLGTGDPPTGVALADVNGDDNLDIVTSDGSDNTVSVLLGDGEGGFSTAEGFATGAFPNGLAVAEITGDDHLDVVTSNGESNDVSLLVGDGNGQFAAPQSLSVGADAGPLSVTVADATGDGVADIIVANEFDEGEFPPTDAPGSVSVLAGDGAGGLEEAQQISLEGALGRAQDVAVGDVTADGEPDIVAARPIDGTVTLLAGDGAGGFAEPRDLVAGWGPNPVAIDDLTADGHLDVVTANAVGENLSILPGDGEGNVGFSSYSRTGQFPHSVVSVDLNHDGHPDVATANGFDGNVSVLINDGAGDFADAVNHGVGSFPTWITSGDIDGNGDPDLITANGGGDVSVLLGDGVGGFAEAVHLSVAEGFHPPYAVAVADINDDGHQDIATTNTDGFSFSSISILLADGTGGFLDPVLIEGATAETSQSIALADVTGDDNIDILVTSFEDTQIVLLAGDGTGGFDEPVSFPTGIGPVFVVAADVTGDDNPDLVSLNHTGQSVSVLVGDGNGGFSAPNHFDIFDVADLPCTDPGSGGAGCPWPWGLAVADVTGDGAPDIVTANTNNSTVSVLPNDGGGDFPTFTAYDTGAHPGAAAVADVTGDGNFDIVTANREGHNVGVLDNLLGGVELVDDEALGTIIRSGSSGPVLTFDPPLLAFGDVEVGTTSPPMTSTLHNNGADDATGLQLQAPGNGFDADVSACGDVLPAGSSCAVTVTFTPPAPGPAEATLSASTTEGASADLPLSGTGVGEGFTPMALEVDPPVLASSGNGVFEPGEAVGVAPAWRNEGEIAASVTGAASTFTGPEGATYDIDHGTADYGLIESGQVATCLGTEVCYQLALDDPAARPAAHWDAAFDETLDDTDETTKTWTLHVGESFDDVPTTNLFYTAIETLLHSGVTEGCTGSEYCPGGVNSRSQMPVFVLRALEGAGYVPPDCDAETQRFSDVPATHLFCPWIEELARRDVVSGCGDGNYCPSDPVTRAQMAIFLLKTLEGADYTPIECTARFDDVPCTSLFADWIEDLAAREITGGCSETDYCPADPVTRGQMAVFVTRTFSLTLYGP